MKSLQGVPLPQSCPDRRSVWAAWLLFLLAALATGCSTVQPKPAPGIVILLSDRSPAFVGVQREIEKRYSHRIENYYLGNNEAMYSAVQKKIQASDITLVVTIGLPAAQVARALSGKRVVFCQVFNYEDDDLVTPWMKGVSASAPVREMFSVWKQLSPGLKTVGAITGKNLQGLLEEAQAAAGESRLKLMHVTARSDKATLYAYKQLTPKIQGLWLVPDNRVLSRDVIRDMMAHSVKEGKQVAVFVHELLSLGGLLSVETSNSDIAEQVLTRVKQAEESTGVPGPSVIPLTKADIRINPVMAKRLNLKIPKTLRSKAHAR